jgi:2-methylisocitrate lyase-like PEP mutase family enzyme
VLYAPGLKSKEDIAAVLSSVDRPINVLMPTVGLALDVTTLSAMGVKRISVGGSLARAALTAFLHAAEEMQQRGTFTFGNGLVSYKEINDMFEP